jgi:hypothetical protein
MGGSNPAASRDEAENAKNVPNLNMKDVILGNVKKKSRQHAEKV